MARTTRLPEQIIFELSKHPAHTVEELAKRVAASRQTVTRHLAELIRVNKVVRGYLLPAPLPLAYLLIGKPRADFGGAAHTVSTIEEILAHAAPIISQYHRITGRYNYIAYVAVPTQSEAFGNIIEKINEVVLETETFALIGMPNDHQC